MNPRSGIAPWRGIVGKVISMPADLPTRLCENYLRQKTCKNLDVEGCEDSNNVDGGDSQCCECLDFERQSSYCNSYCPECVATC